MENIEELKKGEIKSVKIGSHYRISKDSFIEFLMGEAEVQRE